jgi:hypothetical protein
VTAFLRQFREYEPVVDLLRLGCFLLFVGLGLWTARRLRAGRAPGPGAVTPFLLYALVLSVGVGLVQQESWPFTTWALVHNISPRRAGSWEMVGLDAEGKPWLIDPRVLQPMAPEEFGAWFFARLEKLTPEARQRLGRFMLERAEAARRRLRAGGPAAANDRFLGPLSAPYHFQPPTVWRSPADVPATPFTGLQVFVLRWDVRERFADERRVTRELQFEVRDGA